MYKIVTESFNSPFKNNKKLYINIDNKTNKDFLNTSYLTSTKYTTSYSRSPKSILNSSKLLKLDTSFYKSICKSNNTDFNNNSNYSLYNKDSIIEEVNKFSSNTKELHLENILYKKGLKANNNLNLNFNNINNTLFEDCLNSFTTHCSSPERLDKGLKLTLKRSSSIISIKDNRNKDIIYRNNNSNNILINEINTKSKKNNIFDKVELLTLDSVINGVKTIESLESKIDRLERAISSKKIKTNTNLNYCYKELKLYSPIKYNTNKRPPLNEYNLSPRLNFKESIDSYMVLCSSRKKEGMLKAGLFSNLCKIRHGYDN